MTPSFRPRRRALLPLCVLPFLLTASALSAASCSSSSSTADTGDGGSGGADGGLHFDGNLSFDVQLSPYTLDNVCDLTAPKFCALRKGCCAQTWGFDEAGCEAHEKARCAENVAEVKAGTMTFNGTFIDSCLTALQPINDRCYVTFDLLPDVAKVFGCHVFAGKVAQGQACTRDEQCSPFPQQLTTCDKKTSTCATVFFQAAGTGCSLQATFLCDKGLTCLGSDGGSSTCQTATALGQPCSPATAANLQCGLGFRCDPATGLCAEGKAGGVACTSGLECKSLECVSPANTCKPIDPLASAAECEGP